MGPLLFPLRTRTSHSRLKLGEPNHSRTRSWRAGEAAPAGSQAVGIAAGAEVLCSPLMGLLMALIQLVEDAHKWFLADCDFETVVFPPGPVSCLTRGIYVDSFERRTLVHARRVLVVCGIQHVSEGWGQGRARGKGPHRPRVRLWLGTLYQRSHIWTTTGSS
jgi:hypothetical protein